MNLITDQWLPVIRKDGSKEKIAPWQITDGINDDRPIMEIDAPRADFKGALYQFLIGLLQTAFAPEDEDEWLDYWENDALKVFPAVSIEIISCFNQAEIQFFN